MFGWILGLFISSPVLTFRQAQIIGERIAHEKFPNVDYSRYGIDIHDQCSSKGDEWCISYYLIDENKKRVLAFGGGGPEIHIRKKDGKITYANLQR